MKKNKPVVSIVIVNYKVKEKLLLCVESILSSKPITPYEIIIVDNDEEKSNLEKDVSKYPKTIYVKASENKGYGGGNNLGKKFAKGEFIFFLNPDTYFVNDVLDSLYSFIKKGSDIGAVAPLLLDKDKKPFLLQGTKKLGILEGIVGISFINKWLPRNPISKSYWNTGWDKTKVMQIDIIPGTAFMIKKDVFETVGEFDERYFLYFEEYDLCRRLLQAGLHNYIVPRAKIIHYWGESTSQRKDIKKIFQKSRQYYFRKYYGSVWATIIEIFLSLDKALYFILTIAVVVVGLFILWKNLS